MKPDHSAYPAALVAPGPVDQGLTKRELIAAMAMQGLLSLEGATWAWADRARMAVKAADALIEELSK
jgi:hypothetical protein